MAERCTRGTAWQWSIGALAMALTLAVGCGGDDDDDRGSPQPEEGADEPTTTTESTQPPGTSPVDVEPYIAELLVRYDEVTNEIVADPTVATDPNHPLVVEYRSLVEPGSVAEGAIQVWVDNATRGVSIRPYDDTAPAYDTSLDGAIETVSADEVTFPTCELSNYRKYNAQGRETEFLTGQAVPGAGTAVRVDGEWRLRRMDIASNLAGCSSGAG